MATIEKVIEIIADQMHIEKSGIGKDTDIKNDIQADSLDVAQILFALEDEFGIEMPTDQAMDLKTVGQVADMIDTLKGAK